MFHVNPKTGETGKCGATQGKCPFGGMNVHFTTEDAARSSFEASQAGAELQSLKKDGRSLRGNWADIELYRDSIGPFDEVFVHPQGKIVIVPGGSSAMKVFRNGAKASTSGTLSDLRNGRGAWKTLKDTGESLLSAEDYLKSYANTDAQAAAPGAAAAASTTPREQANVAAGYPANSQLDASAPATIKANGEKRVYTYRDAGAWHGSAILPVNEKANPHKDMDTSEWLTGWNYKDRSTQKEVVATIEVWKAPSSTGKGFNYKLVATSGDSIRELGSEGGFYHDQSGSNMGEKWTLSGAFKPTKGGFAMGEIPDRKMPLYTYK